jgi:ribonuclease VapC
MNSLLIAAGKRQMSDHYVLDSSAVMCLLGNEPGAAQVRKVIEQAVISTVNLSEIISKLQERGGTDDEIDASLDDLTLTVISFDRSQADLAGKLRMATRSQGLSLGDRACIALAIQTNAIAVTTDRAWRDLDDIARVLVIR